MLCGCGHLRIQSFSDKASQSNIILVNGKAQSTLAPNVDTEVFTENDIISLDPR